MHECPICKHETIMLPKQDSRYHEAKGGFLYWQEDLDLLYCTGCGKLWETKSQESKLVEFIKEE